MSRTLKRFVRLGLFLIISCFGRKTKGIPVLAYHSIGLANGDPYTVPPNKFRRQMELLAALGYRTLTLNALKDFVAGKRSVSTRRSVLLTFDDGYKDFYYNAFPTLKQTGYNAVVSVVPEFCDAGFLSSDNSKTSTPALSWDEVREISASGFEIASHGMSHTDLTTLDTKRLEFEMRESKRRLEEEIEKRVNCFCYPYGKTNFTVEKQVKQSGYEIAFDTEAGIIHAGDNSFRLKRITLKKDFTLFEFRRTLTADVELYISLLWGTIGRKLRVDRFDIL